jgi:uncharacterized membrane protein YoaK (UPF0700 family)
LIALVGGLLCMTSGWVNAVAFRGYDGGITHVTGTSTSVGLHLAAQRVLLSLLALAKILCFLLGAIVSSAYLGSDRTFRGGPRYAHLLLLVAASTYGAFAAEWAANATLTGSLLLAFASGVQNALTTIYSGAVARTTHVTGTVTDIGIEAGKFLFLGDDSGCWKLKLHSTFLFCYILGGFLGALCYSPDAVEGVDFVGAEAQALLVPATAVLAMGVIWLMSLRLASEPSIAGHGFHAEVDSKFPRLRTRTRSRSKSSDLDSCSSA